MDDEGLRETADGTSWTFLSNHSYVLLCIAREPGILLREVARRVGITERAVQRIIADLEAGGYVSRAREGRRNRYEIHGDRPFRHPVLAHREVSSLVDLLRAGIPRGSVTEDGDPGEAGVGPGVAAVAAHE